ncbi:hypothetical protein OAH34_00645 [bacterium]|nr:hypothetical protein [bacterium]
MKYASTMAMSLAGFLSVLPVLVGCRISMDSEDMAYPTYGGSWQRTNREGGRVGSLFDPAGGKLSSLVDRDQPPTPDAIERQKNSGSSRVTPGEQMEGVSPSDRDDSTDPTKGLMDRKLDDIKEEKEQQLRQRNLEDIEVRSSNRSLGDLSQR